MTGGRISFCPGCGRLIVYGQTCTCGTNANHPRPSDAPGEGAR